MYKHPGVYIEHVPSGVLSIETASTSVAAFIGPVKRGDLVTASAGDPVFIFNVSQFAQQFGVLNDPAGGIRDEGQTADAFGHAVNAFFSNGGAQAYIVPVGDGTGAPATASLVDPVDATKAFYFEANSGGAWANGLFAEIVVSLDDANPANREYTVNLGLKNDKGKIEPIESFDGLSLNPASGSFVVPKISGGSLLVTVEYLDIAGAAGGGETTALLSAPLAALDLGTITNTDAISVTVNSSTVPVAFDGTDASLEELAASIQAAVRAHAPATSGKTGFVAQVTLDRRLLMISGGGVAAPSVTVTGNATANKLGLDPSAFLGRPVAAVSSANLNTKTVNLTVGGTAVAVALAAPADLAAVATQIQNAAQGAPSNLADFRASVSGGRLLLRVEGGDAGDVIAVTGGTAIADLGLNDAAGAAAARPLALDYPQPFDNVANRAESLFAGGVDHGDPAKAQYDAAFERLRDYRDVSIMLLPGHTWIEGGDNSIIESAVTHAEFMQNRMVIVDPPQPTQADALVSPKDVKDLGAPTSPYTALYYPWLVVSNPHYDPDTAANKPKTFTIPPSAFAAGMWARIDSRRGVWKAPAGLEATVRGTIGPNLLIGNDLQDNLNELGINCLRSIIGPTVIWGARTLATKTKPEFRYVSVRRTQNMIGESLYNALQSVVFEPNDHKLWASLRGSVTDFMSGLHRAGAFQGEKASDAYYVRCNLNDTMTQGDIDAGIVRVVVGFAPLKPAEFVVVQIKQIVGQAAA